MDMSNTMRIVILGKTGAGKSSLANTIFGEKLFTVGQTVNSDTRECRAETKSVNGKNITLIDTPGFFDTDRPEEEIKREIARCITECAPGPHAFLIVLKVDRVTEHEQAVIKEIRNYFSEECFKHATVLFTHGDQLDEGQTILEFVRNNKIMSDLMEKCGGRCHVVDNKYWKNNQQDEYRNNQFHVEELLKTIHTMIEANEGRYYTNEMLQAVEEEIQQEKELIRQSSGHMSEEEVSKQAKGIVFERLLVKLVGAATGALLGAFFGVVLMVKVVVKLVKEVLPLAKDIKEAKEVIAVKTVKTTKETEETIAEVGKNVATVVGAGTIFIRGTVASAAIGGLVGGVAGYFAAEGADKPLDAVKRAEKAVKDGFKRIADEIDDFKL